MRTAAWDHIGPLNIEGGGEVLNVWPLEGAGLPQEESRGRAQPCGCVSWRRWARMTLSPTPMPMPTQGEESSSPASSRRFSIATTYQMNGEDSRLRRDRDLERYDASR